ncbi:hypothetical protein CTAYLR_000738 [Chrysophaeum taylorii]|uniref:PKD/REJ-like domain-containing protein n=1 Tax=Chrysophaeum taylorii TaxID=2483200 RepID=A0AAD7U8Q7_9STRA|nr:hypothetical protein CTAYLR_000738 [Chrysophaeum taylorii]
MRRSDALNIRSVASAATDCDGKLDSFVSLDYRWRLTTDDGAATGIESASNDPRTFALSPYTLEAATDYVLLATVADRRTGSSSEATLLIKVIRSDLVAYISGGSRSVPQTGLELVSAVGSSDPDVQNVTGVAAGLVFNWTCANLDNPSDASCSALVADSTSDAIELDLSRLGGYRIFEVTVHVFRDNGLPGASSTSIELYHDVDPPSVFIDLAPTVVFATDRLVLGGIAIARRPRAMATPRWLNTTWSLVEGTFVDDASMADVNRSSLEVARREPREVDCRGDSASWYAHGDPSRTCEDWVAALAVSRCDVVGDDGVPANAACLFTCTSGCLLTRSDVNLVIQRDALSEGTSYGFKLEATVSNAADNEVGFATIQVYVARSPYGGDVIANPKNGIALNTSFSVAARNWEGDELPLRYAFGVGGGQVLRVSSENSVAEDLLLPEGPPCDNATTYRGGGGGGGGACPLSVFVTIHDAVGASTVDSVDVFVASNALAGNALLAVVERLLAAALANYCYECVCNIAIAAAQEAPDDTVMLATITDSIVVARQYTQGTVEQTALMAACLEAVLRNASALALDTSEFILLEINSIIKEAREIAFDDDASLNSLTVLSQLLETRLFDLDDLTTTSTLEERRRMLGTNETTARAGDTLYEALDVYVAKISEPLVADEQAVLVESEHIDVVTRRVSGLDDVKLATGGTTTILPLQSVEYSASGAEIRANVRDETQLTSSAVLRFNAIGDPTISSSSSQTTLAGTTTFLLPRAPSTLSGPASSSSSSSSSSSLGNVTIVCHWNSQAVVEEVCPVDNSTVVRRKCNGTKYVEIVECGGEVPREACVSWGSRDTAWTTNGCRPNSDMSTGETVACDCEVALSNAAAARNDTARDYGSQNVFTTYAETFSKDIFGGGPDLQRSRVMFVVLGTFSALVLSLAVLGHLIDAIDAKALATAADKGGAPPAADMPFDDDAVIKNGEGSPHGTVIELFDDRSGDDDDEAKGSVDEEEGPATVVRLEFEASDDSPSGTRRVEFSEASTYDGATPRPDDTSDEAEETAVVERSTGRTSRQLSRYNSRASSSRASEGMAPSIPSSRRLARSQSTVLGRVLRNERGMAWYERYAEALMTHHVLLSIWFVYSETEPRSVRLLALALEILLVGATSAFENQYEYPDPGCDKKNSGRLCLRKRTFNGRRMCKWDETSGECTYRSPPSDSDLKPEHFWVVLATTVALIPFILLFERSVKIVCATRLFEWKKRAAGGAPSRAEKDETNETFESRKSRSVSFSQRKKLLSSSSFGARRLSSSFARSFSSKRSTSAALKVVTKMPPERKSQAVRLKPKLLLKAILGGENALIKEAREITSEVCEAVAARRAELRADVAEAIAEGTLIGGRKARILHTLERDLVWLQCRRLLLRSVSFESKRKTEIQKRGGATTQVTRWGWTPKAAMFRNNVFHIVLQELRRARRWHKVLEGIHDENELRAKLVEFARLSQLSWAEKNVYQRCFGELKGDEEEEEEEDRRLHSRTLLYGAAFLVGVVVFVPATYLATYASDVGTKATWHWLFETLFLLGMIYLLINPTVIFLTQVTLPGLLLDKLEYNPKLNRATYSFATPVPEDSFDFLLELRPDLKPVAAELVEDRLAHRLKSTEKHELTHEELEEIYMDLRWRNVATVSAGLLLSAAFLRLPELLQDTVLAELVMLAPLGTFYLVSAFDADEASEWNSGMLALATVLLSALFIFVVAGTSAWAHRTILEVRERKVRRVKEQTSRMTVAASETKTCAGWLDINAPATPESWYDEWLGVNSPTTPESLREGGRRRSHSF